MSRSSLGEPHVPSRGRPAGKGRATWGGTFWSGTRDFLSHWKIAAMERCEHLLEPGVLRRLRCRASLYAAVHMADDHLNQRDSRHQNPKRLSGRAVWVARGPDHRTLDVTAERASRPWGVSTHTSAGKLGVRVYEYLRRLCPPTSRATSSAGSCSQRPEEQRAAVLSGVMAGGGGAELARSHTHPIWNDVAADTSGAIWRGASAFTAKASWTRRRRGFQTGPVRSAWAHCGRRRSGSGWITNCCAA